MGRHKREISISSLITAAILFGLAGYILYYSYQGLNRTYIEDDWDVTTGIVLSPDLKLKGGKNEARRIEGLEQIVNYEYQIDGKTYQSNSVSKESYVMLDEYPEGREVDVHYNPNDPTDTVLVRSPLQKHYLYVVMGFCLLIIGVIIYSLTKEFQNR